MPINSQIPLAFRGPQIESPLAQYGQMVQLRALMQQQEEVHRQRQQEEQERAALAQSGGDVEKAQAILLQSGNIRGAAVLTPMLRLRQEQELKQKMMQGNQQDPNFWFNLATVTGKPEYATHGERLKKEIEEKRSMGALQDQNVPVAIGQAPTEAAAIEQFRAGGGRPMTVGVGHEPGAEWSRTTSGGGALSTLMQSPIPAIANHARVLQARINSGAMPLAMANQEIARLHTQETNLMQQQGMQAERLAAKPADPVQFLYKKNPDGTYDAFDGRTKELIMRGVQPPGVIGNENRAVNQAFRLRSEYQSNPQVKAANDLEVRINPIIDYVTSVGKKGPIAAKDEELTKMYLMVTHPKGDQISNLDRNTLSKMPDLPARIRNVFSGFVSGKTLDRETRAEFFDVVAKRMEQLDAARTAYKRDVTSRAQSIPGINLEWVFPAGD